MENFCRKMTISCYLMFQILGTGPGLYSKDRSSIRITDI